MNQQDTDRFTSISKALSEQLLYHALTLLKPLINSCGIDILSDQLQSIETNYRYLTDYFLSNNNDPERETLLKHLIVETYRLYDIVYCTYREQHLSPQEQALKLHAEEILHTPTDYSPKHTFYWFLFNDMPQQLRDQYSALAENGTTAEANMGVTALTLNTWYRFSEDNLLLLCDIAAQDNSEPSLRALTGVLLLLQHYDNRIRFYPILQEKLLSLSQDTRIKDNIYIICRCLLETSLTQQVEQILQNMQRDLLARHKTTTNRTKHIIINLEDLEEGNPEWGEELGSHIGKHIDQMMKLHQSGADFNYTSTKTMLNAPFFQHDIANWFVPFDKQHPDLGMNFDTPQGKIISKLLSANPEACDIDKYATCLASKQMQNMLNENALPPEIQELSENDLQNAVSNNWTSSPEKVIQMYIRCLYRFFRHNPWKAESRRLEFTQICRTQALHNICTDSNIWLQLGDHCLRLQLYEDAEIILRHKNISNSIQLLQKLGYSLQKQGKYAEAFDLFKKALTLQDDDTWTLQHAATCLHRLGQYEDAIKTYDILLTLQPDKKSYLQAKAQCLLESGNSEQALQLFYKLDFLYPDEINTQRGLAWCAFVCDKSDTAEQYFARIANTDTADANDLMNYAHLLFVKQQHREASRFYCESRYKMPDTRTFLNALRKDKPFLYARGITEGTMRLMEDILMEHFQSQKR
ncbi:MAG: tetratricopeptide repeat protein [Paludibacter sp.]|nr:tetratricopeptide repeat protein [Bacteroidales bacterium]MCM1068802.1 tetratricopeptide repeat protein [Prevotella sp.]MCM1353943.1 tetratricopeptide repeat protein [Bacteroides sp.]MCM1443341.1 tetratricopeptide repeat protein [Muribaculum sp.]MCM1482118.1 tetratricopeptide repeat protein [Paludibacter sp.]